MEWRRGQDLRSEFKWVERGWRWAGEDFRQELLEQVDARPGPSHFGEAVQEQSRRGRSGWWLRGSKGLAGARTDLKARPKGEPSKVELAWHLRSQTTMPLAWIAERLQMGSRGHLAWLLQRRGKSRVSAPTDQCLLRI